MAHQTPTQRHDAPEQPTPRLGKARARFAGIVAAIALAALAVGYGVTATSLDLSPAPEAAAEAAEPEQPEAVTAQAAEPAEAAGDTDADAAKTPVKEPEAADEAASEKPEQADEPAAEKPEQAAQETPAPLVIADLAQASFAHGDKPASHTRYIMLHDTAMDCAADGVVAHWLANNDGQIASHFIVDRDGTVSQCVPLDQVAYHAGHGDDASYQRYGVDSMNAWSIGIELSHAAGEDYPEAQLDALDRLVAHIDEWSGTQLEIIDHKMWRSGNVDTSEQFATHLANYRTNRTHNP
ncbi:peptidoglycan recognition family protein [Olsenella sp. YH-ols2217]|uniref:N-acetylmuramoyl-L-alanine amidase n=1 Tax=Kribbibacterium absianum TaxID=3044210 RepID=A0ABT6ZK54_9ACTN|nr:MULTISPECIES: peptidoglycan recognition family protein [unclassified Olsenella]MDJ1122610.1 peptidoglycan recognition family protein [Olsenella sp. YH-ols2216]MDJ1129430.1 peptidoglycan recognition family protein [Olsenella sp. YH-ols2217]